MNDKQFKEISKKLDKLAAIVAAQGIEDKNMKISLLKKNGLTSAEVASIVGMTESGVRNARGWKKG